jgi:hypothetical protein
MNAAQRAREQLRTFPLLDSAPASCGTGEALLAQEHEIVHFHSARDADLHLTGAALERMREELDRSTAVRLHPESPWVTVHLDCDSDADLLVSLVSVALRAHAGTAARPAAACNLGRVEIESAEGLVAAAPGRAHTARFPRLLRHR